MEVPRSFRKHYHGKINVIYIDPPCYTGKDSCIPDNYRRAGDVPVDAPGQRGKAGKISAEFRSPRAGITLAVQHDVSRLQVVRNLLTQDGAIFISIDGSEVENLCALDATRILVSPNPQFAAMIWAAGRKNDSRLVSVSHEYILVYARSAVEIVGEKQI